MSKKLSFKVELQNKKCKWRGVCRAIHWVKFDSQMAITAVIKCPEMTVKRPSNLAPQIGDVRMTSA